MQNIIDELVGQYGIVGIIASVIIIVLTWFFDKKVSKSEKKTNDGLSYLADSMNKLTESVTKQNETLTETLSNTIIHSINETNKHTQQNLFELMRESIKSVNAENKQQHDIGMDMRVDIMNEIDNIIKEINITCRSSRTILFEFHNSNENFNGMPFVKYDATSERPSRDTISIQTRIKDFQFQILYPVIKPLYDGETSIIHYNKQFIRDNLYNLSAVLFSQYNELSIEDVIYIGTYNSHNKLSGVVAIEFNKNHPYVKQNIHEDELIDNVEQISTLLKLKNKE